MAQGPGPILGGQVENIQPAGSGDPVAGAVQAAAAHPTDPDVLFIGAVNGGVWGTMNARAAAPDWEPLTDAFPSLSIAALTFDPTDPAHQTLVAGIGTTSSFSVGGPGTGLLRTTDGGATWEPLGQSVFSGRSVVAVEQRGQVLLVGLRFGSAPGIYRSIDGGGSFRLISGEKGLRKGPAFALAGDPGDPMRIYAAIGAHLGASNLGRSNSSMGENGGLFRTDDAGASWSEVTDSSVRDALRASRELMSMRIAVGAAPGNPVYAAIVAKGVLAWMFRSADRGLTWTAMDLPRTLEGPIPVADASDTRPIVITSVNHGLQRGNEVRIDGVQGNTAANGDFRVTVISEDRFSLDDSAGSGAYSGDGFWSAIQGIHNSRGAGLRFFSIAADPLNPYVVYVGGEAQYFHPNSVGADDYEGRLFRGDASIPAAGPLIVPSPQWTSLTHNGTRSHSAPHADSRVMVFDADGDLLEGDDGGIYRRTSPGSGEGDWFSAIGTLQVTEMHDVAYDRNSRIIVGGTQDNGTPEQIVPGDATWRWVSGGDGGDVAVDAASVPGQSIRYSSSQFLIEFVKRTCDADNVCGPPSPIGLDVVRGAPLIPRFVTRIALNLQTPARILVGGANGVYESADQGDHLTQLVGSTGSVTAMSYGHPHNADLIVAGTASGLFTRNAAGDALSPTPALWPGLLPSDIAVAPDDVKEFYVAGLTSVFATPDAGASWVDITGNLRAAGAVPYRAIRYVESPYGDRLLVGTSAGVFGSVSSNLGCWFPLGEGLPHAQVFDFDYDPSADLLVAGTVGRGAWTLSGVSQFGVPAVRSVDNLAFGDTCVGTTSIERVEICNSGTEILEVASIVSTDPQFSIGTPPPAFPFLLDPDACREMEVAFAPLDTGDQAAILTVQSNDSCRPGFAIRATGRAPRGGRCRGR